MTDQLKDVGGAAEKSSILNLRHPVRDFMDRSDYQLTKEGQRYKRISLLHLYGIPGSGKTQIVRKLAQDFPFDCKKSELVVKHEMDCSGDCVDIKKGLQDLAKQMLKHNLLCKKVAAEEACSGLDKNHTQTYMELLVSASVPILIVIQDPPKHNQDLLEEISLSLEQMESTELIHIYVTSHSKRALADSQVCEKHEVGGLTRAEGLKLLNPYDSSEEKNCAAKIIDNLSGSPLGLNAVKAFCRICHITYCDYLKLDGLKGYREISLELAKKFGPSYKHVFEAIITLLDKEEGVLSKMKTISMFHHGYIPRSLIGNIMQSHRRTVSSADPDSICLNNKVDSGSFIDRIADFTFCNVGQGANVANVYFHKLVFSAVQEHLKSLERREFSLHLKKAAWSIASLVSKDLRKRGSLHWMRSMEPHLKSVSNHFETCDLNVEDFLSKMISIHLREVLGVTTSAYILEKAEQNLQVCACKIWDEVAKRTSCDIKLEFFTNKQPVPVHDHAPQIIKACIDAGKDLLQSGVDISEYAATVLQVKEEDVEFYKPFIPDKDLFNNLQKVAQNSMTISSELISKFREKSRHVFLSRTDYYQTFFIDRMVSILHSLSRVVLYDDKAFTEQRREKFLWTADLVKALCVECETVTGVKLLFVKLIPAVQKNIRLKRTSSMSESQRKRVLQESLRIAELEINGSSLETERVYENGLLKYSSKKSFDDIENMRFYVRTCTKLWKLCNAEEREVFREACEKRCDLLIKKATDILGVWSRSINSIVHCGKFFAAKGEYERAIKLFSEVITHIGTKKSKSKTFLWVSYNYARSANCTNVQEYKQQATRLCNKALQCDVEDGNDLRGKLKEQLSLLTP